MAIKLTDLGRQKVTDSQGNTFEAWVSRFSCDKCGGDIGGQRVHRRRAARAPLLM